MFSREAVEAITTVAAENDIDPAALLALAEVETGGRAFARIDGRAEPLIRFEGHYFDRRLAGEDRQRARRAGLASPAAGAIANPRSQAGRWRMLERAARIDRKAAYESTSWGLGQVMGAHWDWLGYRDVEALAAEARSGALGQARLMARYIQRAGLFPVLRVGDWAAFARGYNGPGYRRNRYHLKLEAAYRKHRKAATGDRKHRIELVLRPGARGKAVRDLQLSLTSLGCPLAADGVYGPATAAAVRRFQEENRLAVDGVAGRQTLGALREAGRGRARASSTLWSRLRSLVSAWLTRA